MASHGTTRDADPAPGYPNPRILKGKRGEQVVFAVLAILIWPVIAAAVVGGYGFAIWMYQLLTGPPGPPGF